MGSRTSRYGGDAPHSYAPYPRSAFSCLLVWPSILAAKGVPAGPYECWFYNTPQPLKNFTLKDGTYIDASGASGSVTISGKKLKFSGGNLDGRTGIYNGEICRPSASTTPTAKRRFVQQGLAKTIKAKPHFEEARLRLERIGSLAA